jgi:hypothetical protein
MKKIILPLLALSLLAGCKKDEDPVVATETEKTEDEKKDDENNEDEGKDEGKDDEKTDEKKEYEVPTKYEFGESVSYTGQTDRLAMLDVLKTEVSKSHIEGASVDADVLKNIYQNKGSKAVETSSGTKMVYEGFEGTIGESTKNLSGKTETNAEEAMLDLLDEVAQYSGEMSDNQSAGLVFRASKGAYILVNDHGQEYTQLVEKGLMGSCFYNQIVNSYLSDGKIGEEIENTTKGEGKKYTDKQHHFDEAFGYFGVPTDWDKDSNGSFWGKYCNSRNEKLNTNSIFDDFLKARAAIDNDVHADQIQPVKDIITKIEKVAAGTAINYLNKSKAQTGGDRYHSLTEGLCFLRACKYGNSDAKVTPADVADIEVLLNEGNFWDILDSQIDAAVEKLAMVSGLPSDL